MRIIISGGKTGGHLIPGIALYEEARSRGHDVLYFLGPHDNRFVITSRIALNDQEIVPLGSLSRKLSLQTPLSLLKILGAFGSTLGKVRRFHPDVVIITGGYISNPVALSALFLGIPLYILEQNTVAGITNRCFAPFSQRVFTSFPHTEKIPRKKAIFTGNPSLFATPLSRPMARDFFSLPQTGICLGVIGGSQGAMIINGAILDLLPFFRDQGISLIWSTGSHGYTLMQENGTLPQISQDYPMVRVFPFIERMDAFWGACDGVIARSGATTIAECIMACCPALFIPIHQSPDDHQKKNALALVQEGAADILEEPKIHEILPAIQAFLSTLATKRHSLERLREKYQRSPEKTIMDIVEKERKHQQGGGHASSVE
ncbi:MAG: UDP-N-acetylglucosamine--N-acetylmuramyl-(pentapeptide) pyrophosphoryl-undecaprenol N-acetylglucosamine transferase [Brevinematales bacterium]|nr:UDP-N-acetylglucosamine--N-acetylmuramyl-(pentapeptide) pyrophosphoryl-undecaprenol N-acetylglucosamine transferase [Brevinematales bacterium]